MGKSTRFPNLRPKWMLTHPFGGFMATEALKGLNLSEFSTIYFVVHKQHEIDYRFSNAFIQEVKQLNDSVNVEMVWLEEQTNSQPETVYTCIKQKNITGSILVKDSDNFFITDLTTDGNCVCYFDLNDGNQFNARNKSYIQLDNNGYISNIVEKKIISSTFSVGGYGFSSAETFCEYFNKLNHLTSEIYMSNIIFEMLLDDHKFVGIKTSKYEDWGTLDEWNRYKKDFKTLFVDLDGTLISNTSPKMFPFVGSGVPLEKNIKLLQKLYQTQKVKIIITTARPEKYRELTEKELSKHNIPYDNLLMELPHSERIIINDFAGSNPFPSCTAINIQRNSNTLGDYLL